MIRNKKIKIMLMFFALAIGSQSMHAYWLEPITKTLSENKIATVMSLSTLVLGYICYCYRTTNNHLRDINKNLVIKSAKQIDEIKKLNFQEKNYSEIALDMFCLVKNILENQSNSTNSTHEILNLQLDQLLKVIDLLDKKSTAEREFIEVTLRSNAERELKEQKELEDYFASLED